MSDAVESWGGKIFTVRQSLGGIVLGWTDDPMGQDGDAVFEPADARKLSRLLMAAGVDADKVGHELRQGRILREIAEERDAQDALFGVQDLPDGTGPEFTDAANMARDACDAAFSSKRGTFRHVFIEEVYEAFAESDPAKLRAELVQAVAVGVKWIEGIDRREGR
jgi:hypothetical protein